MKSESFFITLMSNSSMHIYENNKTSSFTVLLPQKITLSGRWFVALSEIHYNYNFFNVTSDNNKIRVKKSKPNEENSISQERNLITSVQPGYYKNISQVISIINDEMTKITGSKENVFSFDEVNGRTQFAPNVLKQHDITEIRLDDRLCMQLGFQPGVNFMNQTISPHAANIHFGIADQMLIYTDIIEPTFIGHEKAYVLKIVNTQPRSLTFGDACYKEFHKMHYMPLQKREFETISVDIRDYNGNFMPFLHGVLTLKLHFIKQDG